MADPRAAALLEYRTALLAARETEGRLQARKEHLAKLRKQFDKTEDDLKALQVRARALPPSREGGGRCARPRPRRASPLFARHNL